MPRSETLFAALFLGIAFAAHSGATIYNSNGSVANIQSIHDTQAVDGDTITLPAGTFSWTTHVEITKGITIQGQTTISGAGGSNPVIADNTIIEDNSNHRTNLLALVKVTVGPTQFFRLTGITFTQVLVNNVAGNNGAIQVTNSDVQQQPSTSVRIDH